MTCGPGLNLAAERYNTDAAQGKPAARPRRAHSGWHDAADEGEARSAALDGIVAGDGSGHRPLAQPVGHRGGQAWSRLLDAIAEDAAQRAEYQVFGPVQVHWDSSDGLDLAAVGELVDWCQQSLTGTVVTGFQRLAGWVGVPRQAAGMAAGVCADLVLIPVIGLQETVSLIIAIVVISCGFITGQPHLIKAGLAGLLRVQFRRAVRRGCVTPLVTFWPTGHGQVRRFMPPATG